MPYFASVTDIPWANNFAILSSLNNLNGVGSFGGTGLELCFDLGTTQSGWASLELKNNIEIKRLKIIITTVEFT